MLRIYGGAILVIAGMGIEAHRHARYQVEGPAGEQAGLITPIGLSPTAYDSLGVS